MMAETGKFFSKNGGMKNKENFTKQEVKEIVLTFLKAAIASSKHEDIEKWFVPNWKRNFE